MMQVPRACRVGGRAPGIVSRDATADMPLACVSKYMCHGWSAFVVPGQVVAQRLEHLAAATTRAGRVHHFTGRCALIDLNVSRQHVPDSNATLQPRFVASAL